MTSVSPDGSKLIGKFTITNTFVAAAYATDATAEDHNLYKGLKAIYGSVYINVNYSALTTLKSIAISTEHVDSTSLDYDGSTSGNYISVTDSSHRPSDNPENDWLTNTRTNVAYDGSNTGTYGA